MKTFLRCVVTVIVFLGMQQLSFGQTPNLGRAGSFVLFSANGPVSHTGISQISGKVGTNVGSSTGFGNVNGGMHDQDTASANAATDLLVAYGQIDTVTPNFFIASPFGNGDTLISGTYELGAASQLSGNLYLDAEGDSNAYFIIRIMGQMTSASGAKVHLVNGAQACNVYWQVEGAMTLATGNFVRGTFIVNNGAIILNTLDSLEGRLFTTVGAITVNGISANVPVGCGSIPLTGPAEPNMGDLACFALFSASGAVTNTGISRVTGDVGTNVALTTGFDSLLVEGTIHLIPDSITARAADSLAAMYTYLNTLPVDIELMEPAQFGRNLILTPHVYLLDAATQFDDSLFLDAMGDSTAVFVITVNGALTTNAGSKVILINEAKANKVYWKVDGALSIAGNSFFKGTVVVNNGAINVASGVRVDGRLMTTTGLLNTEADTIRSFQNCSLVPSPEITSEPVSQTVCDSQSALFTVVATGDSLVYQWQRNGVNLVNGLNIAGATSDSLRINPATAADTAGTYTVIVSGSSLPNDTSVAVKLNINPNTQITGQPVNQTSCLGAPASFSVTATGINLSYQWRKGNVNLVNGVNITGADSNVFTVLSTGAGDTAFNYNVIVSGLCGPADTSNLVSLSFGAVTTITVEPVSKTACAGSTAFFSVAATGPGLTYQWRKGNVNLVNAGNILGATDDTLFISAISNTDTSSFYNVIVSGSCLPADTSVNVSLTIDAALQITGQPGNQVVCLGNPATFSVTVTGGGLAYQWRRGNVNVLNSANVSGANSATLMINVAGFADSAFNYNVIVTGLCGSLDTSDFAGLFLATPPVITAEPVGQTVCTGASVSFSVTATGSGLTYQWRKGNVNLLNAGTVSGANSPVLIINPALITDTASNYNVIVSGGCLPNDTSVNATLTVNLQTLITVEPIAQTVCVGSTVSFSVGATGSGLLYQWRRGNVVLLNAGNISGAQSSTLVLNPAALSDAAVNYNVIVTGSCGIPDTSVFAALTVNALPVITTEPVAQTLCAGASMSLSVVATGTGLNYQWRKGSTLLTNTGNIAGVNSATLTINPISVADSGFNYNVIVSGSCLPSDTSVFAAVVVNTAPVITNQPVLQSVCLGAPTTFTVTVTGAGLTYQWRRGIVNLANAGTITGVTTATLAISSVALADAATDYNVVITGTCTPPVVSADAALVVNTAPTINANPTTQTVCEGSSVSFTVSAAGSGLFYQWRKGIVNLTNTGNVSGANSATLTLNPVSFADVAADYNVVVGGTCTPGVTSADAALSVNELPVIQMQPADQAVCNGGTVTFTATALGSGISYQWFRGATALTDGGNLSGTTTNTFTINPATTADAATDYYLVVTGICIPDARSTDVSLTIENAPFFMTQPKDTITCIGCSVAFTVTATGDGLTYQWRRGTLDLIDGGHISGANTNTLVLDPASLTDNDFNYNVVVSGNCGLDIRSDNASLLVCIPIGIDDISGDEAGKVAVLYPNPFSGSLSAILKSTGSLDEANLVVYNGMGVKIIESSITKEAMSFETFDLATGVYFYRVISKGIIVQTGKLISQR